MLSSDFEIFRDGARSVGLLEFGGLGSGQIAIDDQSFPVERNGFWTPSYTAKPDGTSTTARRDGFGGQIRINWGAELLFLSPKTWTSKGTFEIILNGVNTL